MTGNGEEAYILVVDDEGAIRYSISNLHTFPYVNARVEKKKLTLHGAWFDISTGELWVMNPETGDFVRPDID